MSVSFVQQARQRAFFALGAMIVGILVVRQFPAISSLVWLSMACGILGVSIVFRGRWKSAMLVLGMMAMGGGLVQLRIHERPTDRLDRLVGAGAVDSSVPIEIQGVLIDPVQTQMMSVSAGDPPMWTSRQVRTRIAVDRVYMTDVRGRGSWVETSGIAKLILPDEGFADGGGFGAGDRVEVLGMFSAAGSARNFGDLDWGALNAQSGRVGTVAVTDWSMMRRIEHVGLVGGAKGVLLGWRGALRVRALGALGLEIDDISDGALAHRSVLGALLLGERDPSFDEVYESFQRVGVAHVLAISGFHLSLVILLGVLAIRLIGEHPRVESVIIVTILVLGVLVIPMRPPIVRAGVIVSVLMISGWFGRRYDRLTVLAWVGVGLLIWRPMDVFSLGYQLSMGITGLLVMRSYRQDMGVFNGSTFVAAKMNADRGVLGKLQVGVFETVKGNFACWAAAMPAIAYHAGIVSVLAPVVSLVLIPLVVGLMVIGYGQIAIGVLSPELANETIGVSDWLSRVVSGLIQWVDGLGWSSVPVGSFGWVWTLVATAWVGAMVTGKWKMGRARGFMVGIGLLVWAVGSPMVMRDQALLRIDMLDVGDGTGVLIQSGGEGLIWDCGSLDRRVGMEMRRAARAVGVHRVDDVIVTHDNIDHFNGLLDFVQELRVDRVWMTRRMIDDPSPSWRAIEAQLVSMGVEIFELKAGGRIALGDVELECLWPDPGLIDLMSQNNTSAVARIKVRVDEGSMRTVLLTGDIEGAAMEEILLVHPDLDADVLELPHHGSIKPGALGFVDRLDPLVVLQSTGVSRLNDPRWDALRLGRVWYATAEQGGVWVRIMGDGRIEHGWARGRQ